MSRPRKKSQQHSHSPTHPLQTFVQKNITFVRPPALLNCDISLEATRPTTVRFSNADFTLKVGRSEFPLPGIVKACKNLFFVVL